MTVGARPTGGLPAVSTPWGTGALVGGRLPRRRLALVRTPSPRRLYDATGRSRVRGRVVVLRPAASPARQAELAAGAGAAVLVLADPAGRAAAPGVPPSARHFPAVVALAGPAATSALATTGGTASFARQAGVRLPAPVPRTGTSCRDGSPARFSGRGGYGAVKPELVGPGAVPTPTGLVAGTGVAAAYAARAAAVEARRSPDAPLALRSALAGHPPAPLAAGHGAVVCAGRVPAGPLQLRRTGARVDGVSLVLGRVAGTAPVHVSPASRLDLALLDPDGKVARLLTPPGGALDLLPGEYAYTLPRGALSELAGRHVFRAVVHGPDGSVRTLRSEAFGG